MLSRLRKLARLLVSVGAGLARLITGKGGSSHRSRGALIEVTIFRFDVLPPAAAVAGGGVR